MPWHGVVSIVLVSADARSILFPYLLGKLVGSFSVSPKSTFRSEAGDADVGRLLYFSTCQKSEVLDVQLGQTLGYPG